ncbi:hypothetical protein Trydic_g23508 [Trypoxylus dichotomus]
MLRLFLTFTLLLRGAWTKYLEGELRTSDNWAFLARFCFLSGDGQFEYYIEYNEEQGQPNLLLYYDTADQWPSVYKTTKSCAEKESVLKIEQNQVVNLTINGDIYRELSGCTIVPSKSNTHSGGTTTKSPDITKNAKTKLPNKTTKFERTSPFVSSTITITSTSTEVEDASTTETLLTSTFIADFVSTTSSYYNFSEDFDDVEVLFSNAETENATEFFGTTFNPSTVQEIDEGIPTKKSPIRKRAVPTKRPKQQHRSNGVGSRTIACHNARKFRSSRERWWFVAVSNCNGSKGIHIKYRILMTNGLPGDYWHEHFSADEFYVLPVLTAFSVAYSFLILGIVICSVELKSRQLLHTTYKLFVVSVFIQFCGIILNSMAYLKYAVNGVGAPCLKMLGAMCMGSSETCFLLMLLLLAKGYTITRGRLSLSSSVKLTVFMCLYSITFIALFVYEAKVFDPGEVLYLYESPAGYGLITLRVFAWFIFIYSTVFTLKKYPEKSNFYYPFNIFGTLWFIAGPAFILSANTYIDKWIRESIVCAVLLFITFGGHLMFLLLTMPSVANKNFPYHVRTTQIGVMEVAGISGSSTIEHFNHHAYEPSRPSEHTVIIPLTKRTEELFGGIYRKHLHNTSLRNHNCEEDSRPMQTGLDIAMENVLTWSLAKNISALEYRHDLNNLENTAGLDSPDFRRNSSSTARESPDYQTPQRNCDEWARDVPVELFTVSKLVVNKKSKVEEQEEQ